MRRRFHRRWAVSAVGPGTGPRPVIGLRALQRLTVTMLGSMMLLGGLVLGGATTVVARLGRLAAHGDRTRAYDTRRSRCASCILTA
jgi:hypothetical protein